MHCDSRNLVDWVEDNLAAVVIEEFQILYHKVSYRFSYFYEFVEPQTQLLTMSTKYWCDKCNDLR